MAAKRSTKPGIGLAAVRISAGLLLVTSVTTLALGQPTDLTATYNTINNELNTVASEDVLLPAQGYAPLYNAEISIANQEISYDNAVVAITPVPSYNPAGFSPTINAISIHLSILPLEGPGYSSGDQQAVSEYVGDLESGLLPPPAASPSLYVTLSLSPNERTIYATPTISTAPPPQPAGWLATNFVTTLPSNATTIQQAATDLGYSSFQWQQIITIPVPSPYFGCTDPTCDIAQNVVGTSFDPPVYGWDYCHPGTVAYAQLPARYKFDCTQNFPYYPDFFGNTTFTDTPTDTCLSGGTGNGCGGETASEGEVLDFSTFLIGVPTLGPPVTVYDFNWTDSFNGTSGMIATTVNDQPVDPGSGTGGITIVAIDGVPVNVPEPSTLALLTVAIVVFRFHRREQHFEYNFSLA